MSPEITSIVFDKPTYAVGETITATVSYTPGTSARNQTLTGTAFDSATNESGTLVVTFSVVQADATIVTVSDSGNRQWAKVSDTGSVAVFTATA